MLDDTVPATTSTGEPGFGTGAAAGAGVADCSICAATIEDAATRWGGTTCTVTSAITHHLITHAEH
jgi:hypothetical protein